MDSRHVSEEGNGSSRPAASPSSPPPLRRRLSMDEDWLYQRIMTAPPRRPSIPPSYDEATARGSHQQQQTTSSSSRRGPHLAAVNETAAAASAAERTMRRRLGDGEVLPAYSCSVHCEGVFSRKMELEETTKRAEYRNWQTVFVVLRGTALNIHGVKKDWGFGKSREGPTVSPDNPPWMRKSKLWKSYSLLHADVGIAADYRKRRYVIRVRAETDQFLLSCIELSTFIKWLEALFAAIDISTPLDDRDFPRDFSVPRIQRIRWHRGQDPAQPGMFGVPSASTPPASRAGEGGAGSRPRSRTRRRSSSSPPDPTRPPSPPMSPRRYSPAYRDDSHLESEDRPAPEDFESEEEEFNAMEESALESGEGPVSGLPPPPPPPVFADRQHRLSTTSYPNDEIDLLTGKWAPEHHWTDAHDMLYARLCYSLLLFKSPRKSNYIINKGKQWFVDWATGRMVRVLPPTYSEIYDYLGPWHFVQTENRRI